MLTTPPTLESKRLILRALTPDDFEAYCEVWQNETVVRFLGGTPLTEEACWARLLRTIGHWQVLGYGFWGIEHRETGHLIGETGFWSLRRGIVPSLEGTYETGWGMLPAFHGKGLAHEAVTRVMDWAQTALAPQDFSCIISPDNAASLALAQKLGFQEQSRTFYNGPTVVLQRPFR